MRLFDDLPAGPAGDGLPLIVDSFAGGGGASTGIELALGRAPDIAINHDGDALAMHEVNHPATLHLSKNIWHVDPLEAVGHRRVGLAWFSPDCKHFSKAKGGRPVKRSIRDLAWVVVLWARRVRPEVIILENVEEFRDWGPVSAEGKPCRERRGQTFELWTAQLKRLGYRIEWKELRACDYGAPTIRKRFFMIARRDGRPIVWPEPTHGKPDDPEVIAGRKLPWRTAAEIIDWSLPCPSIFDTSEEIMAKFGMRAIRPLADATMKRIARGVVRYVLEAKKPFIVRTDMASAADRNGVNPLEDPVRTLTTAGSHAVVVPSFVGCGGRAGQSAPRGGDDPLGTQTAKPDACVVAPVLVETAHGEVSPKGVKRWGTGIKPTDEPMGTGTISGNHALAAVHLTKFQSGSTGSDAGDPVPTVTANSYIKRPGGAAPIGVVAAHLSRFTQNGVGQGADEPLDTVMAGAPKFGVVAAFLAQHNTDNPGHDVRQPVSTLTTGGSYGVSQQGVVQVPFISRQFGQGTGQPVDAPAATITADVNKSALIAPFLTKYYGTGDGAKLSDPMHTDTVKDRMGFVSASLSDVPSSPPFVTVEIDGQTFAIADIGMRMLTPRERFRAQGFPDDYIIDRRPDGSAINGTVQGRCCGNSVCPPLAEALVRANCGHLAAERVAAE